MIIIVDVRTTNLKVVRRVVNLEVIMMGKWLKSLPPDPTLLDWMILRENHVDALKRGWKLRQERMMEEQD